MIRIISLYLNCITLCGVFFMLYYAIAFVMGYGGISINDHKPGNLYWLFVLIHLLLHSLIIIKPQKFTPPHLIASTITIVLIYAVIAMIL